MNNNIRLILRIVSGVFTLAICVTAFIYSGKDMDSSNADSKTVTDAVASVAITNYQKLNGEKKETSEATLNVRIRKIAHCLEYMAMGAGAAIFALTFLRPAGKSAPTDPDEKKRRRPGATVLCALALGFCLSYASLDEIHQYFVPGRAGTVQDVALDFLAAGVSVLILWGCATARKMRNDEGETEVRS